MNETADNNLTLMVVDDDEDCRVLLSMVLAREGYHVIAASDGVEAQRMGCQGYVTKPIDLDELKMLVDLCLRTGGKPDACCGSELVDSELAEGNNLDSHPGSTRTARVQLRNHVG